MTPLSWSNYYQNPFSLFKVSTFGQLNFMSCPIHQVPRPLEHLDIRTNVSHLLQRLDNTRSSTTSAPGNPGAHLSGHCPAFGVQAEREASLQVASLPNSTSNPKRASALPPPKISPEDRAHTYCIRSSWREPAIPWAQGSITKC